MDEQVIDAFGRTITISDDGVTATYRMTDGGDLDVSASWPSSHPRDAAIATLEAMAPHSPVQARSVPDTVQAWKLRIALRRRPGHQLATLLDEADALAAQVGGDTAIGWQRADEIHRSSPALAAMTPLLGLTPADVDAVFVEADAVVL